MSATGATIVRPMSLGSKRELKFVWLETRLHVLKSLASSTYSGVRCPHQAVRNQSRNGIGVKSTIPFRFASVKSYLPSVLAMSAMMRSWPCMSWETCAKRREESKLSRL